LEKSTRWPHYDLTGGSRFMGRGTGVRAASAASISISFEYHGRCREKIRLVPTEANLKYCRNLKALIEAEIAKGTFDYAKHFPKSKHARRLSLAPAGSVTVGAVLIEWLASVKLELEPETYEDYAEYVHNVWIPRFGPKMLSDFTLIDATTWVSEQTTRGKKRILNLLTPLREAMRYAVKPAKLLTADPLAGIKVERPEVLEDEDEIDPFTKAETDLVFKKLEPAVANMTDFWVWTGLRFQEVVALLWTDIDFDRGVVRIARAARGARRKVPKTRAGRREVKLLPPALDALQRQKPLTRMLHREIFLNPGTLDAFGGLKPSTVNRPWNHDKAVRRRWKAACAAAGVRYRPPKQLRHTYASWMLMAGEVPMWVSRQMGHKDLGVTLRVYTRFISDMAPDAGMKAWSALK
jgi:integrase